MSTNERSTEQGSTDRLRFDRADRIATQVLLWLAVAIVASYPLLVAVDWFRRQQVTLTDVPLDVAVDAAGVGEVVGVPTGDVLVGDVSGGRFALLLASGLLLVAGAAWGALLLGRFLRDLGRGEPFLRANVTRLRIVALLFIVVPLAADLLYGFARSGILVGAGMEPIDAFLLTFQPGWVVVALLVAAVAQAFVAGSRLREDVEGLV